MRRTVPALGLGLIVLACGLPADVSDQFSVEMDEDVLIITLGDTVGLGAVVTRNGALAPTIPVVYTSSDPTVAVVTDQGLVRGVSVGQTEISARALGIEVPEEATRLVRVLRSVAIESVTPSVTSTPDGRTVAWGELVEIVGVGLDPDILNLIFVNDVPAPIESFVAAPPDDDTASDTLRIWIPALVPEQSTILLSRRGGSTAAWPINVLQHDVLEPNDITRRTLAVSPEGIDLRGLALEVRPWLPGQTGCHSSGSGSADPDTCWSDGYTVDGGGEDVTVVVKLTRGSVKTVPITSEFGSDGNTDLWWIVGQRFSLCYDASGSGSGFYANLYDFDADTDSLIWAIRDTPGPFWFDITLLGYESIDSEAPASSSPQSVPYDLRIRPGYHTDLPPDPAEGNDDCHRAATLPYPLGSLDLTFDHGRDLDWFKFTIPGTRPDLIDITPTPESEPNDGFLSADSLGYGDRATGEISGSADVDYFTFEAIEGEWIDIEVRADRNENSNLNSLLQLYFAGQQIAFNDDFSNTTFDSRITLQAPATGTYIFSVQDTNGSSFAQKIYEVDLRRLGSESNRITLEAELLGQAEEIEFRPFIQVIQDDRANDGEVNLLAEFERTASTILTPGDYLVFVYNKAGQPAEYRLHVNGVPVG